MTPEQAQGQDFQDAVEQAVADELGVEPDTVTVTSVTTNDDGHVVVVYVVQGVDPEDIEEVQQQLESGDMADAIGDNLQDAGFKGADVQPADAAPATVEISQEPVIESDQPVNGVSLDQAQSDEFLDAFEEAVAGKLGVSCYATLHITHRYSTPCRSYLRIAHCILHVFFIIHLFFIISNILILSFMSYACHVADGS